MAYVDQFLPEDEVLNTTRRNAAEVGGAAPVSPVTGGTLRFIAAAMGARAVVEIGTGCGTSGIWLLRGMRPGGVLTSVDVEPEHQRLARAAFLAAGFASSRYRLIGGLALEVLPRLADGAYDMVFCDADPQEDPDYLTAGAAAAAARRDPGLRRRPRLRARSRRHRRDQRAARAGAGRRGAGAAAAADRQRPADGGQAPRITRAGSAGASASASTSRLSASVLNTSTVSPP